MGWWLINGKVNKLDSFDEELVSPLGIFYWVKKLGIFLFWCLVFALPPCWIVEKIGVGDKSFSLGETELTVGQAALFGGMIVALFFTFVMPLFWGSKSVKKDDVTRIG